MLKLRKFNAILIVVLTLVLVLTLSVACDGNQTPSNETPDDTPPSGTTTPDPDPDPEPTPDPTKKNITGVTFSDVTLTYDGAEHEIVVDGTVPDGVSVSYSNNKGTEIGEYYATATLTGDDYNTLKLNATLTIVGKDITGITFTDKTVTYNGTEHEITVDGTVPDGVSVKYTNNKGTDAGTYNAVATLSGKGYNTLTLNAKLTIDKAEIVAQLTFANATVEYDALPHSIYIVGNVPAGVTVAYYYNDVKTDSVTAVGTYEVKAVLSGKNYVEKTLTAKLTIKSTEEMLYSAVFGGKVYFQNNLDGNRLYSATGSGSSLTKVSSDVASYFTSNGSTLYFYSSGLLSNTIKSLSGSTTISSVFNSGRSTYLTCDNDGNIYYAKANLIDTKKENGIYKVNLNADEPTAIRLTTDKADDIAYYNGYIYYCNNSDGSKLYRIAVTANEGTGTKLIDYKISNIIVEDGAVYYTQHETLNSSIWKYTISSGTAKKLCNDNGAYLTKVNDEIYYVNKDLLTSNIFGKGIYKVSIDGSLLGVGTKVLEAEDGDGYYSLTSDGNNLFYYKTNDKHFYRYNLTYDTETDLMRDFEPVETVTFSASPYAHLATYNGEIYYTNVLDSNNLYKYNPQTKAVFKVLTDSVSNVFFHDGCMYYSTFVLTNYALWKLDLTDPEAEPVKISSHRYENLIFDGDDIYAIRVTASLGGNCIVKLSPSEATATEKYTETALYDNRNLYITKLYLLNGTFHFTINPVGTSALIYPEYIYTHNLADNDTKQEIIIKVKSDNFVIYNGKYYYHNHDKNTFCSTDMNTGSETVITQKVEITDIFEYNGVVYYSSKSSQNTGVYAYNIASGDTTKLTDKVGHGFQVLNGNLYFVNLSVTYTTDYPQRGDGDGHLYSVDLTSKIVTKVA